MSLVTPIMRNLYHTYVKHINISVQCFYKNVWGGKWYVQDDYSFKKIWKIVGFISHFKNDEVKNPCDK